MASTAAADGFRRRLESLLRRMELSQAAFARLLGIDRSTLSQLLAADNNRLPRAETLTALARGCGVSVVWLLGLSQREQIGAQMVEATVEIEAQAHAPIDARFMRWLGESAGRKTRSVPMTFPDFLKTDAVADYEYSGSPSEESRRDFDLFRARIGDMIGNGAEFEVCAELQALEAFAAGAAQWRALPRDARHEQMRALAKGLREHYPSLRLFLYDLRQTYSAPFTVFGTQRAAIYVGPTYLVLNGAEHIKLLTRRFDELVRLAVVQPHDAADHVDRLRASM